MWANKSAQNGVMDILLLIFAVTASLRGAKSAAMDADGELSLICLYD